MSSLDCWVKVENQTATPQADNICTRSSSAIPKRVTRHNSIAPSKLPKICFGMSRNKSKNLKCKGSIQLARHNRTTSKKANHLSSHSTIMEKLVVKRVPQEANKSSTPELTKISNESHVILNSQESEVPIKISSSQKPRRAITKKKGVVKKVPQPGNKSLTSELTNITNELNVVCNSQPQLGNCEESQTPIKSAPQKRSKRRKLITSEMLDNYAKTIDAVVKYNTFDEKGTESKLEQAVIVPKNILSLSCKKPNTITKPRQSLDRPLLSSFEVVEFMCSSSFTEKVCNSPKKRQKKSTQSSSDSSFDTFSTSYNEDQPNVTGQNQSLCDSQEIIQENTKPTNLDTTPNSNSNSKLLDKSIDYVVNHFKEETSSSLDVEDSNVNIVQEVSNNEDLCRTNSPSLHSQNMILNQVHNKIFTAKTNILVDVDNRLALSDTIMQKPTVLANKPFVKFHTMKNAPNHQMISEKKLSSPFANTIRDSKQGVSQNVIVSCYGKQPSKLSVVKCVGLPTITVIQGDGDSTRQIGLRPIGSNTFDKLKPKHSTCSSASSTGEDFTQFSTDSGPCWQEMYTFSENETLRFTSRDPIFTGAIVSTNSNFESIVCPANSISSSKLSSTKSNIETKKESSNSSEQSHVDGDIHEDLFKNNDTKLTIPEKIKTSTPNSICVSAFGSDGRKSSKFKVPVLPPAKRPPHRTKSNISMSSGSSGSTCSLSESNMCKSPISNSRLLEPLVVSETNNSQLEEDDAISMFAESIQSGHKDFTETRLDIRNFQKSTDKLPNKLVQATDNPVPNQPFKNLQVISLKSSNNTPKEPTPFNLPLNENFTEPLAKDGPTKNGDIAHWTSTGHLSNVRAKIDFSLIPDIFKPVCYYYYTFGCFKGAQCRRAHIISRKIRFRFKREPFDSLIAAYCYAKDRFKLYSETVYSFIESLRQYPKYFNLLNIIKDAFEIIDGDKLRIVNKIISAMESRGQAFNDIVWEIMFREGNKNDSLLEVLFIIVCGPGRKRDLPKNWNIIRQICKYSKLEFITYKLIQDIMIYCIDTNNRDLTMNLTTDIILNYKGGLDSINISTLNRFYSMLQSFDLNEEARGFRKKLNAHNIYPLSIINTESKTDSPVSVNITNDNSGICTSNSNEINLNVTDFNFNDSGDAQQGIRDTHFPDRHPVQKRLVTEQVHLPEPRSSSQHGFSPLNLNVFQNNNLIPYDDQAAVAHQNYNHTSFVNIENGQLSNNLQNEALYAFKPFAMNRTTPEMPDIYQQHIFPSTSPSPGGGNEPYNVFLNMHSKPTSPMPVVPCVNYKTQSQNRNQSPISSNTIYTDVTRRNSSVLAGDSFELADKQLSSEDLKELQEVIKRVRYEEFIMMLHKYKNSPYTRSFYMNAICFFKNNKPRDTTAFFKKVIEELKISNYVDPDLKNLMRIFCVNIIAVLDIQNEYEGAADILATYYNDIHYLINTTWLSIHRYNYSPIGKYFYFCKIFTKGEHYQLAFNLFTSPELKLLQGQHLWALQYHKDFDLTFRNEIVQDFIVSTLKNDLNIAMLILRHMLTDKNCISEINIWKHFNTLISKMVDNQFTYLKELNSMFPSILQGWHRALTDSVLRGLLVMMVSHKDTAFPDIVNLYNKCCLRNIYPKIRGDELRIPLTTNMTREEIFMILRVYLDMKAKFKYAVNDLIFDIRFTTSEYDTPRLLLNSNGSIMQLKSRVCSVLAKAFNQIINVSTNGDEPFIKIEREKMRAFFVAYTQINPPEAMWDQQVNLKAAGGSGGLHMRTDS